MSDATENLSAGKGPAMRTELAEAIANLPIRGSYSPIVLAGVVRLAEFALICLTGVIVYAIYLYPLHGIEPAYLAAVPAVAAVTVGVFQAFDIYHVGAFRTMVQQGFKIIGGWILVFLMFFAIQFFFKLEGVFSRVFFAGVPHHADCGVPCSMRVAVSAPRMRVIGDGWLTYFSNSLGPIASRRYGSTAGMNSITCPSTSSTGWPSDARSWRDV